MSKSKQIIQLNNEFTQKNRKASFQPTPKRKHLGLILVVAILLFSRIVSTTCRYFYGERKGIDFD